MICKLTYNDKLVVYCYNKNNNLWYYYDNSVLLDTNIVRRATYLDINAIPYLLLYQKSETFKRKFSHLNLKKANYKIRYTFKFPNGLPQKKIFFGINITVGEAKNEIKNYFKLQKVNFVIKAKIPLDKELLSDVNADNTPILVI